MCQCCFRDKDDDGNPLRLGDLHFPGRRIVKVCSECIDFLWRSRNPHGDLNDD